MSKKTVIRTDLIGSACQSEILAIVAKAQGIKSMTIDDEKCTLTVVGTVDPVCIVCRLKKKCFAATIVSVEDEKPKEKKDACKEAKEACEKLCKERCEKLCKDGCEELFKDGGYFDKICTAGCQKGWCTCTVSCSSSITCPRPLPIGCHGHGGMWPAPRPLPLPPPPPRGYSYGSCYEERSPECVIQ